MMAQDRAESTREPINHRIFTDLFPPDTIKSMRLLEGVYTKNLLTKDVYIV